MNIYITAAAIVLGTAVVVAAYQHTVEQDIDKTKKLFAQIAISGAIISYIVIYLSGSQKKPRVVNNEPFGLEPVVPASQPVQVSVSRSVPMPSA